jgi:serine protease inhibitor
VDEEGTVAAAATAVAGKRKRRAIIKKKVYEFVADQPFFFLLEHAPSKSIVFTAKIYDPSK